MPVDQPHHRQRRGRDDQHLQAHRKPLDHDGLEQLRGRQQIAPLRPTQPNDEILGIDIGDERQQRSGIGDQGGDRRPLDPQRGHRPQPQDEDGVQRDIKDRAQGHELQGRDRIANAAQRHRQQDRYEARRHRDEDHPQIGKRQRKHLRRGRQRTKDHGRGEPADEHRRGRDDREQAQRRPQYAAHRIHVATSHILADQNGGRHAEAKGRGDEQEHDDIGVGRRGQRALAQKLADPDGVDRPIQRLQRAGSQRRQCEEQQGLADRSGGQVSTSVGRAHGFGSPFAIALSTKRAIAAYWNIAAKSPGPK